MPDWSNIFNILFVAVGAALSLFFLISVICVAVKGKRRCNAFDVILRILSTLAFIAAVALFAVAVLTMLDGSVCIKFETTEGAKEITPVLVFMSQNIELPLADLFVMMTTTLGSELALVLLVCSLAALIVDCLVANKRADKKPKTTKTPEQLKREAEIAKIQRIGEQAVRKTESAASAQATPTQTQKPETDWREQPEQPHKTEFVGIKEKDDDFDTFDTFDDVPSEREAEDEPEETLEPEQAQPDIIESEADEPEATEQAWNEPTEQDEPETVYDEPEDEFEEQPEQADVPEFIEEEADEVVYEDEPESEQVWNEPEPEATEQAWNEPTEQEDEPRVEQPEAGVDLSDIEPDRDIYIPDIKTITRTAERPVAAKPARTRSGKPKTGGTPSDKKRSSGGNGGKGGATKTAPSKSAAKPATKPSAAKTRPAATTQRTTEKPAASQKLPVTKRYVILDRRSAANMFGEYLKERDREAKDKLTSSINTIIIE